jgi:hypothetical protein
MALYLVVVVVGVVVVLMVALVVMVLVMGSKLIQLLGMMEQEQNLGWVVVLILQ